MLGRRDFIRLGGLAAMGMPAGKVAAQDEKPTVRVIIDSNGDGYTDWGLAEYHAPNIQDAIGLPCPVCGRLITRWDVAYARMAATGRYGVARYLLWSDERRGWIHEGCK